MESTFGCSKVAILSSLYHLDTWNTFNSNAGVILSNQNWLWHLQETRLPVFSFCTRTNPRGSNWVILFAWRRAHQVIPQNIHLPNWTILLSYVGKCLRKSCPALHYLFWALTRHRWLTAGLKDTPPLKTLHVFLTARLHQSKGFSCPSIFNFTPSPSRRFFFPLADASFTTGPFLNFKREDVVTCIIHEQPISFLFRQNRCNCFFFGVSKHLFHSFTFTAWNGRIKTFNSMEPSV